MKFLITVFCLNLLTAAAVACPDFSGTYIMDFDKSDDRAFLEWTLKQSGCEKIAFSSQVTLKNGKVSKRYDREVVTDGKLIQPPNYLPHYWGWEGDKLVAFEQDVNTDHCNSRDVFEKDAKGNLIQSWRFECPQGNSPWFTPDTKNGWRGSFFRKK